MSFYTNVFMRGNKIYVRGYDKGLKFKDIIYYKPYMFLPKENGTFKTLDNKPVEKISFDSIFDAKEFNKRYEDVSNFDVYGLNNFLYLYIYDTFKGDIDYDPLKITIGTIDIECRADSGFPDIKMADKELTAITVRSRGRSYVFGCGDFTTKDENIYYVKCQNEHDLVQQFLLCWEQLDIDIVTGWNIELFDIPYLVNRIRLLFNDSEVKRLSPWKMVDEKSVEFRGKENQSYSIVGISVLDYYQLYRKFSFGNQESYKLDYISQIELGEKKIDYSEYGSLLELYKNNYQKFIEYNIHDCILVDRLDDKLKFLEQVMALAYDAKVNYNDTLTTVRPWDIIIHNYLLAQNIVVPQVKQNQDNNTLVGGHVKEVKPGLYKWVVSFDLNSLYPHLIMQYNISPETFVNRVESFPSIDGLLKGELSNIDKQDYSWTANGCIFKKNKLGFLPALMDKMYNERSLYKKKMIDAKKRFEKSKSLEDSKLVSRYHNMQLAKKIQLNSAYGALANKWFRWFSFDLAESITTSGQLSIRFIESKINILMNNMLKTKGVDYIIAVDTDSIYIEMGGLIDSVYGKNQNDELSIVKTIDKFCEDKITPYIDKSFKELSEYMNSYDQKMIMKRETIANKGIWKAAKNYILNAWNVEGVQYDKPQLKITGIEAVRSSTPYVCRERIKESLKLIMNSTESELISYVTKFRNEFNVLPFEDIASPRGVNNMSKYKDNNTIYKKATPIHVRGSLLFNNMIKKHNLNNIQPISDGDKIKFAYLKLPNPIHNDVIAVADHLPKEFNLDSYIDRDLQFDKAFLDPLKKITDIIGWEIEKRSTLERFFE